MQDLSGKTPGSNLPSDEWNELATEVTNIISAIGQSPSSGTLVQILRSITEYGLKGTFFTDSGADGITYTLTQDFPAAENATALKDGMRFLFIPAVTSTVTNPVANVTGFGPKLIALLGDADNVLPIGAIEAGRLTEICYNATLDRFDVIGGVLSSNNMANKSNATGATVTDALNSLDSVSFDSGSIQFITPGVHQHVVPAGGYSRVKISLVGAGGGGGEAGGGGNFGGGGGAYCVYEGSNVPAATIYDFVVGAGGTGNAGSATVGGDTTLAAPAITAGGGGVAFVSAGSGGGIATGAFTYGSDGTGAASVCGGPSFFGGGALGTAGTMGGGGSGNAGAGPLNGGDGAVIIEYWV